MENGKWKIGFLLSLPPIFLASACSRLLLLPPASCSLLLPPADCRLPYLTYSQCQGS
jgi:hypothetical protein